MNHTIDEARTALKNTKARSAWERGVITYALELLDDLPDAIRYHGEPDNKATFNACLLNGARDWSQYSWGGCSLIYNGDIAERLCTPSELKKTRNGEREPNAREDWLDVQARALRAAALRVYMALF